MSVGTFFDVAVHLSSIFHHKHITQLFFPELLFFQFKIVIKTKLRTLFFAQMMIYNQYHKTAIYQFNGFQVPFNGQILQMTN